MVPSEEVRMVPDFPTETNNPVLTSSSSLQEIIVKLKNEIRKTNKIFFILYSLYMVNRKFESKVNHIISERFDPLL